MADKNIYIGSYWKADADKKQVGSGNLRIAELMKALETLDKDATDIPFIIFDNDKGDNPKRPDFNILLRRPIEKDEPDNGMDDDDDVPF